MRFSARHNVVLYYIPDPSRVLALIQGARLLPDGQVAVPYDLRSAQIMRHLGYDAMSPIETEYDFPSRFPKPRPNQLVTAAFKTLYPANVDTSDMRCVDAETEYLSPPGWRRMDQYDGGQVAQYILETGEAEFVQPLDYHRTHCSLMYRFEAEGIDQKLSPGHRVLYVEPSGERKVDTAENIALQAVRPGGFTGRFITTFKLTGRPDVTEKLGACVADTPVLLGMQGERCPVTIEPTMDGMMYCFMVPSTFLVFRRNGKIFVSGNTGKTLSSLWAADYLMGKGFLHKCLVVAPLSTLRRVWETEVSVSFHGRRKCVVLHGSREQRIKKLAEDADFFVINPDGIGIGTRRVGRELILGPIARAIMDDPLFDLCLIDELSIYKHASSERYKILQRILESKRSMWRWGLTGTPAGTAPTDAWAQGRLIYGKDKRPSSFETFRNQTMTQVSEFKWRPKSGADQIVANWLQPSVRFTRKELGFPALSYEVRDIPMTAAQKQAYADMRKNLELVTASGHTIDAVNEAALRTKLIQIACGAIYGEDHEVHYVDAAPRIQEVADIIEEAGGKFLIFAPLTSVVNMLYERFKKEISCERVNGHVPAGKRNEIFGAFQEKAEPRVLICDPRTMAHGLSLTAASTIIWFAPTDNLELYEQANARIDGPEACGVVIQLSSSPVEKDMYRRQQEKQTLQGSILTLLRAA